MAHGQTTPVVEECGLGVTTAFDLVGVVKRTVSAYPRSVLRRQQHLLATSEIGQRAIGFANGAFGERADARGNTLPAATSVRVGHRRIPTDRASLAAAYPATSGRLVVLVHGLVETERSWFSRTAAGNDFGSRLAADVACSPVYVRYNTGRHITDNGRELTGLLSQLVQNWPTEVTEIVLIGHSMGGLVARSALHHAHDLAHPWLSRVVGLVCLGTPHTGAPLERGVARTAALLGRSPLTAPLRRLLAFRSNGIQDLAKGYLHQTQEAGCQPPHQPADTSPPLRVRQLFVAATLSRSQHSIWAKLVGDLLVRPASAADSTHNADVRWLGGLHHFDLLRHDRVYHAILQWLRT
jgi:pimeloyl-ACP methyl ester carboxylesterase